MIKILFTDFANIKPDNADLIVNPDYADMTCSKTDNADHHFGPINEKYTPLVGVYILLVFWVCEDPIFSQNLIMQIPNFY